MTARSPGGLSPERKALLAKLLAKKGVRPLAERGIPRRSEPGPARLTFAQEAIWFLDQLEPDRALHNVPGAVRLTGTLDQDALARSLREIIRRHEALRTTIVARDGTPYQRVAPPPETFELPLTDLASATDAEALVSRLATEEAHRPFDLERGPLFRAFLLRLGPTEHVLVLNFHHIVTDGWSMGVFTRELDALYRAFLEGRPSPLDELPIQMADFACWQRAELEGTGLEAHLDYWRRQLAGNPEGATLPPDKPRPPVMSFRGGHRSLKLSAEASQALRALSQRHGVTLFMTLNAAFQVLFVHALGRTDVLTGSAVAHRNRKELEGLIGFLVNMLVLRADLSGDPPFTEVLRRVKEVTLGAWAHQDVPLPRILKEVQPERDLSRSPLFQVQFSLLTPDHNPAVYGYGLSTGDVETIELPGLVMTPIDVAYDNARYDLAVFLWDMPEGIQGTFEYLRDLYEDETVARFVARYERLLELVVERPEATIDELARELARHEQSAREKESEDYERSAQSRLKTLKRRRGGRGRRPVGGASDEGGGA